MAGKLNRLQPRVPLLGDRLPTSATVPGSWRAKKQSGQGRPYDRRQWRDGIRPAKLREDPLCEDCMQREARAVPASEVDHVDGDSENNAPDNLRSLCKPCHSRKTAEHDGSFGRQVDRK